MFLNKNETRISFIIILNFVNFNFGVRENIDRKLDRH